MILYRRRNLPVLLLLFAPVAPVGCTGPNVSTGASSGLTCVDDSSDCVAKRQRTLRYLVDDQVRQIDLALRPVLVAQPDSIACDGSNFTGANLSRADLSGAKLTGANLIGANLSEAKMKNRPKTRWKTGNSANSPVSPPTA